MSAAVYSLTTTSVQYKSELFSVVYVTADALSLVTLSARHANEEMKKIVSQLCF